MVTPNKDQEQKVPPTTRMAVPPRHMRIHMGVSGAAYEFTFQDASDKDPDPTTYTLTLSKKQAEFMAKLCGHMLERFTSEPVEKPSPKKENS